MVFGSVPFGVIVRTGQEEKEEEALLLIVHPE